MKHYKEFTFGWLIFVFVIPIHLLFTYWYLTSIGGSPMDRNNYVITTSVFVLVCLLFYGMTTRIGADTIEVSFGIGLIRKRIQLQRIKSVDTVKSPWYYGWGIRIIPHGMLYNITGTDGVELTFKDTSRIVRIGSRDAATLKNEIEKRLA